MEKKENCWEFKKCGREPGGEKAGDLGVCAAATYVSAEGINSGVNGGRFCWAISGTLCEWEALGSFAQKLLSCLSCDFYKMVRNEEGAGKFVLLTKNRF